MHLCSQRCEIRVLDLIAQARDEIDIEPLPIQLAAEIKQVRLEQPLLAADCRSCANRGNARMRHEAGTRASAGRSLLV